jgi:hypothetical protein
LLSSVYHYVDPASELAEPVRIAILDSGLDPENPFLIEDQQLPDPRIKEARSFVRGTESHDIRDEIGHGTHALGLLLKVAPCAEIYVARIARRETLDSNTYDDIAKVRLSLFQSRPGIANDPCRPSITQSNNGKWTSYLCRLGFVNITRS